MVFRPTFYRTTSAGLNAVVVRDNYNKPCGIAAYLNLFLIGFGLSVERNPKEPAAAGKMK